jgi:hypothetical protein
MSCMLIVSSPFKVEVWAKLAGLTGSSQRVNCKSFGLVYQVITCCDYVLIILAFFL